MIEILRIKAIPALMMWREEVLRHVFGVNPTSRLLAQNHRYYREHIADDSHYAIEAKVDGEQAGCGGICITEELPSPDNPTGKCAYLMNIYVRERFRHHGVAHEIVKHLVNEARSRQCGKIYLETTENGRPVYESLGFRNLPDIMKLYD